MKYCAYCGGKMPDDGIFCTSCGRKVVVPSDDEPITNAPVKQETTEQKPATTTAAATSDRITSQTFLRSTENTAGKGAAGEYRGPDRFSDFNTTTAAAPAAQKPVISFDYDEPAAKPVSEPVYTPAAEPVRQPAYAPVQETVKQTPPAQKENTFSFDYEEQNDAPSEIFSDNLLSENASQQENRPHYVPMDGFDYDHENGDDERFSDEEKGGKGKKIVIIIVILALLGAAAFGITKGIRYLKNNYNRGTASTGMYSTEIVDAQCAGGAAFNMNLEQFGKLLMTATSDFTAGGININSSWNNKEGTPQEINDEVGPFTLNAAILRKSNVEVCACMTADEKVFKITITDSKDASEGGYTEDYSILYNGLVQIFSGDLPYIEAAAKVNGFLAQREAEDNLLLKDNKILRISVSEGKNQIMLQAVSDKYIEKLENVLDMTIIRWDDITPTEIEETTEMGTVMETGYFVTNGSVRFYSSKSESSKTTQSYKNEYVYVYSATEKWAEIGYYDSEAQMLKHAYTFYENLTPADKATGEFTNLKEVEYCIENKTDRYEEETTEETTAEETTEEATTEEARVTEAPATEAPATQAPATEAPATAPSGSGNKYSATEYLNIRSGAGTDYDKLGQFAPGDTFTVIGIENGWAHITMNDGREAYVSSDYIQKAD